MINEKVNRMSLNHPVPKFLLVALCGLMLPHNLIAPVQAFDPPPGQGSPGSTAGGASRPVNTSCLINSEKTESLTSESLTSESLTSESLTLVAPKAYLGLTTQAKPSFWVYLPASRAKMLEFSIFDRQHQGLYQTQIEISNRSGFIQIKLPETAPELNLNQSYSWTIALVCNPKRRTEDWVMNGWIQRQAPSALLQQQMKTATTDFDRFVLYRQSQFWYDAITLLLNSSPSTISNQTWTETFKAAGLPEISDPQIQRTAQR
jgi:Domain of Unknown Function (DUF928)